MASKPKTVKQSDNILVSGYIRNILNHRISTCTIIPKELILICQSFMEVKGTDYIYSSDFDKNGICYALATNFGKSQWLNPMQQRGRIDVTAEWNRGHSPYILSRKPVEVCSTRTGNNKNGTINIDFKSRLIVPTAYTWRHGDCNADFPLNWNFEGSVDGKIWRILKKHKNDSKHGINGPYKSHTWMIEPQSGLVSYRMFRFRLIGIRKNAIHCSGFEIYGRFIDETKQNEEEYQQIIADREMKQKEKEKKEKRAQERKEKCEPIKHILHILLLILIVIFIFVPDIASFIIGIKEDHCSSSHSVGAIGINLYLIIGSVFHFVAIGICIACLWTVLLSADTDNYWDDERKEIVIACSVCCVGVWTVIWSIIGCVLYSKMDKNSSCGAMIISWAVLKILESLATPFALFTWSMLMGFATYDYE